MVSAENGIDFLLPGTASGLELEYPARVVPFASWLGHTPFALWLVGALKPRIVVELGVHTGNSYCAFLQAVRAVGLDTRCFGIDHWMGDAHAGHYGDEVYQELQAYHDPRYGTFSTLLRTSFEGALPYFSEGSVDLLHIDGFHTYEAVSADFKSWLPKVSSRGVALFHDINVRERGFGIWQFWEELTSRYPHFEFLHSHGLGIVYLGNEPLTGPLKALFAAKAAAERESIQNYFARLGTSVVERLATQTLAAEIDTMKTQMGSLAADLTEARLKLEKVDRKKAKVAALEAELSTVRAKLEESGEAKDRTTALEAELAAVRSKLEESGEAKDRTTALEAELAAVRSKLEQANTEAEVLKSNLEAATLQAQIKTSMAHQRLAVTARLQRELLKANLEKHSYQRQLDDVLQSKSWRLTKPIRKAVNKWRRLRALDRLPDGSSTTLVTKS
ncbi:class I SAM-dependent methyltransferase [Bradyrhizobium sp.]